MEMPATILENAETPLAEGAPVEMRAWERLASAHAKSPFAEPWWNVAWQRNFGAQRAFELVATPEFAGVFERAGRFVRRVRPPFNPHVPFVEIAMRPGVEATRTLLAALQSRCDVLELPVVADAEALREAAAMSGAAWFERPVPGRLLLGLPGSAEELRAALPRNIREDTGRKRRKIERTGQLEFAAHAEAPAALLEECFALERASWKGAQGSAIACRAETRGFYCDVAQAAGRRGQLALYTLRLDGRLIAFELCLRHSGVIHLLKLSFDETLGGLSPGNVLRLMLLEAECGRAHTYDFGIESEWKRRWTTRLVEMRFVQVYFPHLRGRAAWWFGPRLRGALKRLPGLHAAARRLRAQRRKARRTELDE